MQLRKHKKTGFLYKLVIFLLIFATIIVLIDAHVSPIIRKIAEYQGREIAAQVINRSVNNALTNSDTDYKNLVKLSYNNSGNISSVETNVTDINKLQSQISMTVNSEIKKISESTIEIPVGTLSGISFFNAQGPILKFKIIPVGFVNTQLASEFSEAGINQTLHKITLNVNATVTAIVPGHSTDFDVSVKYIISDTVVIGSVPEGYTYITGDNRDTTSKINDYGANKNTE